MSEYSVHRYRFGDYLPSPVRSLAEDPFSKMLAVGREDGSIEILDPNNHFSTLFRLPGISDFKLQSLCWSTDANERSRLFGISLKGVVFEVDFTKGSLYNLNDTYGGGAWCIASSPRANILALGCEDGAVRLFRFTEGNRLDYFKSLPTTGSRVLSLAYHPTEPRIYIGCSDGTIRSMDENTGKSFFRMTGDVNFRNNIPSFWTLIVLSDSTVISGDSQGQIQIWDGSIGVLMQTHCQHTADILTVAANAEENLFYASGIDGKIACFQRQLNTSDGWKYTYSHRVHTHDVFTLAIISKPKKKDYPGKKFTLVSGGLDSRIALYSADDFDKAQPKWLPLVTDNNLVSSSLNCSTLSLAHQSHVDLWNLTLMESSSPVDSEDATTPILFLRIKQKEGCNIWTSAMHPSGKFIIISTFDEVKIWGIGFDYEGGDINLTKFTLPDRLNGVEFGGVSQIAFSRNGDLCAVYSPSRKCTLVFDVSLPNEESKEGFSPLNFKYSLSYNIEENFECVLDQKLSNLVKKIEFSEDNKFLAVASCMKTVTIFNLENSSIHWTIKNLSAPIADISFLPSVCEDSSVNSQPTKKSKKENKEVAQKLNFNNNLVVLLSNNSLLVYNTESISLADWAPQFPSNNSISKNILPGYSLPHENLKFSLTTIVTNYTEKGKILLVGPLYIILVDFFSTIPSTPNHIAPFYTSNSSSFKPKKRSYDEKEDEKEDESKNSNNLLLIESYRNILYAKFPSNNTNSLLILENPWSTLTAKMPSTLARKRYGT